MCLGSARSCPSLGVIVDQRNMTSPARAWECDWRPAALPAPDPRPISELLSWERSLSETGGLVMCHNRRMAMSDEHKQALKRGRAEARAIKGYLKTLEARRPGRPVTRESLQKRLERVSEQIEAESDPLKTLELTQKRLDIEEALNGIESSTDRVELEKGFVEHARSYSERKGISYTAWRELGVPASVLRSAGIKETRRR